ncbi:low density lipoprotein receptor protein [Echinococcus multilocularis]|uniref:Low density lipoprotein receptor protein n=1 Tax=Echinococcus multilocularis TaxID=6211 RepID=A0A087VYC5_ECHMU|nr:low density lipoprotein receptor protein [Echinococcus multilocularis]
MTGYEGSGTEEDLSFLEWLASGATPRNETHVWEFKAANTGQIVIRKRYVHLFPGDELTIFDDFADSKTELARYSTWNSSASKVISSGDSITLELTNNANLSVPVLEDASHIFGFNFTLEGAGFCSLNDSDRASCEFPQEQRCYSVAEDRCDGFWDCPLNGLDEISCSCPSVTEFACADFSVSGSCYSLAQRCDGVYHCADKSDEMDCLESQCSLEALRFLCVPLNSSARVTGECVPLERICDDHLDCANGVDEAPHLCRSSEPAKSSSVVATIAQLFAAQVAQEAVKEAVAAALSRVDSRLRTLLTYVLSALFGPLLIVLTVGLVCRSSASSSTTGRRSAEEARRARQQARFNSPIQRLIRDEIRRRPPPPTYEEALNNSLFEEPILEGVVPPPPPEPLPGALSQDRIAAVRELSMKPTPTRVDVAISCNLLGDVVNPPSAHNQHYRRRRHRPLLASPSSPSTQLMSTMLATPTAMEESEVEDVPQSPMEGGSGQGLLGRWFVSTLGSWRRAGSGNGVDDSGSRRDYEQPEISEATVVSSMHEEEGIEDEYASIASRRESVNGEDEEEADGVAEGASMEGELLLEATTTAVAGGELENLVVETSQDGGDNDGDHFSGPLTPLLIGTHSNVASVGSL